MNSTNIFRYFFYVPDVHVIPSLLILMSINYMRAACTFWYSSGSKARQHPFSLDHKHMTLAGCVMSRQVRKTNKDFFFFLSQTFFTATQRSLKSGLFLHVHCISLGLVSISWLVLSNFKTRCKRSQIMSKHFSDRHPQWSKRFHLNNKAKDCEHFSHKNTFQHHFWRKQLLNFKG